MSPRLAQVWARVDWIRSGAAAWPRTAPGRGWTRRSTWPGGWGLRPGVDDRLHGRAPRRARARWPTCTSRPSSGCRRRASTATSRSSCRRSASTPALFGRARRGGGATSGRPLHVDALAPETADADVAAAPGHRGPAQLGIDPSRALAAQRGRRGAARAARPARPGREGPMGRSGATGVDPGEASSASSIGCAATAGGVAVATHDVALLRRVAAASDRGGDAVHGRAVPRHAVPRAGASRRAVWGFRSASTSRMVTAERRTASPTSRRIPAAAWWLLQDLVLGKDKTWRSIRRSRAQRVTTAEPASDSIPWVNSVFEQPWWLDAVAPGAWGEAVVRRGDEVVARLPYVAPPQARARRRSSSRRSRRPSARGCAACEGKYARRLEAEKKLLGAADRDAAAVRPLPPVLRAALTNWLPFYWAGFQATVRYTYRIEDLSDLDRVRSEFQDHVRRAIRKAQTHRRGRPRLPARASCCALDARDLRPPGAGARTPTRSCAGSTRLAPRAGRGGSSAPSTRDGRTHAVLYVVWDERTLYALINARDPGAPGRSAPTHCSTGRRSASPRRSRASSTSRAR